MPAPGLQIHVVLLIAACLLHGTAPSPPEKATQRIEPKLPEQQFRLPEIPRRILLPESPQFEAVDHTVEVLERLNAALRESRALDVWSLDPFVTSEEEKLKPSRPYPFHGYHSLGRETLKDQEKIQKLITAIVRSIGNAPKESMDCFEPRHGLRIYTRKGFVDLVICYECLQGILYDGKDELWFATDKMAEPVFDAILADLGLKKAD